jgi:hypothetical protein
MLARQRALTPSIVRARRVARWLPLMVLATAVAVIAGASIRFARRQPVSECERAVGKGELQHGVDLCLASYQRTGDPHYLGWAAQAYLGMEQYERSGELARRLIGGPGDADGHRILSNVILRTEPRNSSEALAHAKLALAAYSRTGDARGMANAALAVSQAGWQLGTYTDALAAADQALRLTVRLGDPHLEMTAHLARADALRRMGDEESAEAALRRANERAISPCDRTWAFFKTGMLQLDTNQDGRAKLNLKAAEDANRECRNLSVATAIDLAMAWQLREKDPAGALARLNGIARPEDDQVLESLLLRGYLAADRGALDEAEAYLVRAEAADEPDADWRWEVALARAELAELRGGPLDEVRAEYHYRRTIQMIGKLRSSAQARSAYLVSSHRGPYEGLISLLARAGRWRDALAVILELDASDMLRATAAEVSARNRARSDVEPSAAPSREAGIPPRAVEDVLAAWRGRDLVIVLAPSPRQIGRGRERAYRLRVAGGRVTGEDVGEASAARKWAEDLFADPSDQAPARALGQLIVPPDDAAENLDVLGIGVLGTVPLAALVDGAGAPIIARRPLARILALRPGQPAPGARGEPPVVIANSLGDLFTATREGYMVARVLGDRAQLAGAYTSTPATRAALWSARHAELLHVAGHVGEQGRWRALLLQDGDVTPDEIVQRGLAPRLAVLASCGSAAAHDEEGWGSIAAALLQTGTDAVIATDRTVEDLVSFGLMHDFYAQPDWRADPARALARVQAARARANDPRQTARAWAPFTVLRRPPG